MRTNGRRLLAATLVLAAGLACTATPAASAAVAPPASLAAFRPLAPVRVLDTRTGLGAPSAKPGPGSTTTLTLAGVAGISATASAVVLNVTATEATGPGFVQVFPTGGAAPGSTSSLNVEAAGDTVPNLVVVKLGTGGQVSLYTQAGAHLIADAQGYFEPAAVATAGRFVALPAPQRLIDTRDPLQVPLDNPGDIVDCGDFADWAAANVWFWTYRRFGDPAGLDGNDDGRPCNALPGAPAGPVEPPDLFRLGAAGQRRVPITTNAAIPGGVVPAGASAVVLNVTATEAAAGYVQIVPTGGATPIGASSNLNVSRSGQTVPNLVTVPVGADGTVTVYSQSGGHVIADVAGYFTGPTAPLSTDGLFQALDPARILDTRTGTGYAGPVPGAGAAVPFAVAGRGGVLANGASAAFLNATITEAAAPGFVQLYPTGAGGVQGTTSNLNVERVGQTRANAVFARLGAGGQVTAYTLGGGHLVADVAGYFLSGSALVTPPPAAGSAAALLAGLLVAPKDYGVPYDRDAWGYPSDLDGDCQNARAEVLVRDAIGAAGLSGSGCFVTSGSWSDVHTGLALGDPDAIEIDHLVPLADAHRSGGAAWSPARKAAFANAVDGPELNVTATAVNRDKSDATPDQWKPPLVGAWCAYATDWIAVKATWDLTVSTAERNALTTMLATC